ncbi:hypothetical protein SDC9_199220 [bioreactor metagenome]|uniref:Uncharacterized protein n=1 Tax=bioreactor metagenome TaxID=1076179 RepID=A0A645IL53_9ZZZZ
MLEGNIHRRFPVEGNGTCQHFVQNDAERVDIRTFVHLFAPRLFGRKIMHGAHHVLFLGSILSLRYFFCDTEIRNKGFAFHIDQDIVRFDVAVDKSFLVGVFHGQAQFFSNVHHKFNGESLVDCNDMLQGLPVDKVHNDVIPVVVCARVECTDDIRMLQAEGDLNFLFETVYKFGVFRQLGF